MKICKECDRAFVPSSNHRKCPKCRSEARRTECQCGASIQGKSTACVQCSNGSRTGEASPTWKGGRTVHRKGYVMVRFPEHPRAAKTKYVFEHILVMEEALGRYLVEGETVHHKNGQKDDNRPENLELWSRSHPTGVRAEDAVNWAVEVLERYAPEKLK